MGRTRQENCSALFTVENDIYFPGRSSVAEGEAADSISVPSLLIAPDIRTALLPASSMPSTSSYADTAATRGAMRQAAPSLRPVLPTGPSS